MTWQTALAAYGTIIDHAPLAARTTLGVGGTARWLFSPRDADCLQQAMAIIPQDVPLLPLGRGSNLLIADSGYDGLVLDVGALQSLRREDASFYVGAGIRMPKLAQHAAQAGLTGLEFMATVPGDVGGGVAMNAGAFGQQVSDTLCSVRLLLRNGIAKTCDVQSLKMRYRSSVLPAGSVVMEACFTLLKDDSEAIRQRMRNMRRQRSESQPLDQPNCGSVFKNPDGDYAARLIEQVGLKGHRIGQAQISPVHANFIVNHGQAQAADVVALIRLAQTRVQQECNIFLEPEVRMLGVEA